MMLKGGGPTFKEKRKMKDKPMLAKHLTLIYLIYLQGASVFIDRSQSKLWSKFVPYLYELDKVGKYA